MRVPAESSRDPKRAGAWGWWSGGVTRVEAEAGFLGAVCILWTYVVHVGVSRGRLQRVDTETDVARDAGYPPGGVEGVYSKRAIGPSAQCEPLGFTQGAHALASYFSRLLRFLDYLASLHSRGTRCNYMTAPPSKT